ncbi:alpha/beta hydrolase [uncultured Roseovarius sp.]|uniref:alpha/beta fold hydrolase n=1 Tax=uncultured Roseovarius sp. TaxID=293344 RepID=UPI00260DBF4F|nr:alpha/beta hydrolase [uncultured Roseovarius sp.]
MPVSKAGTAYDLTGPEDAPVVAMIHGLGLTRAATYREMIPMLAGQFRVLSYDLCGHGESALPQETPSLNVLSEQLIALMDELRIDRAALVGFSLGGMINRRVAMDHPDRVSALCILNSPHERGEEQQKLVEDRARDTSAGGPGATIDATLERWFTEEFRQTRPDVLAEVRDVVMANHHENYALHRFVLAAGVVELIRPQPPITHPTLIITCENDSGQPPAMSHAIGSEIDGAGVIILPGLQHMGLVERPDLFAGPVKGFLRRVL